MPLVKENIKVGSVIHRFNNETILILKISVINDICMTYDALILPSKKLFIIIVSQCLHFGNKLFQC